MDQETVVHLVRHGQVENPEGVLYGQLLGYHLSDLGQKMAERLGEYFTKRDVAVVIASPLERAQETAEPIAAAHGQKIHTDDRLIEAANVFAGQRFGIKDGILKRPTLWPRLYNPFQPSWGEPYRDQVARMRAAMIAAREEATGHEAVLVSHQLPIWVTRLAAEHRRLWHDPRRRECSLASVTSFRFVGARFVGVDYAEPAADLLPARTTRKFVAGA